LTQTEVNAPTNGYVVGLTLRPGQRVAAFPMRSWMAFVDTEKTAIAVGVNQNVARHIKPGDSAEVVLKLHPGRTYAATVEKIAYINPNGQLQPNGVVAEAPSQNEAALPYAVVLTLNDERLDVHDLPGGATGSAAIYTDSMVATHFIRKVMMRMESYVNYVKP